MKRYYLTLFIGLALIACDKKPEQAVSQVAEDDAQDELIIESVPAELPITTQQIPVPPPPPLESIEFETFAQKLARAALERTTHAVFYDGSYRKISYPMGDVPEHLGVCTDVVVRSYRQLGIDLQELVHEDMKRHFKLYPNQKRWGLSRPDTNIDHRRVPNLRVFFARHGELLPVTDDPADYKPGDLVTWKINTKMVHIGIVAEETAYNDPKRHLIIHNIGRGPELSDMLFDFEITGHYRYHPVEGI